MQDFYAQFKSPLPEELHHYTGISALIGMARTRALWAGHIYFLNDASEVKHACDLLQRLLTQRSQEVTTPRAHMAMKLSRYLATVIDHPDQLFVISLSARPSLLSQWRSYTPHGKGVSIAFTKSTIEAMAAQSDMLVARCLYETAEQLQLLNALIEYLEQQIDAPENAELLSAGTADPSIGFFQKYKGDILRTLAIIKHRAFSEEDEWRLISRHTPSYMGLQIQYREGGALLAPYIEVPLPKDGQPFESVTLGPSPHPNLALDSLSKFLSQQALCSRVKNSGIPYRVW